MNQKDIENMRPSERSAFMDKHIGQQTNVVLAAVGDVLKEMDTDINKRLDTIADGAIPEIAIAEFNGLKAVLENHLRKGVHTNAKIKEQGEPLPFWLQGVL